VAAASVVLMAVMLPPASAVAQEGLEDPSAWVTTTDPWSGGQSADARLTVTDVSVTSYDGFDRVVFRTEGDGEAGWSAEYGPPVRVTGAVALAVTITGLAPPGEGPTGADTFEGEVAGPADSVVLEVVSDVVADGRHTFFIGLDDTLLYRVVRIVEPKAIAIDFIRGASSDTEDRAETEVLADGTTDGDAAADEGSDTEADAVPVGGVETGWGGLATGSQLSISVALGGLLLLLLGTALRFRRRRTA
jgi:LPXTG-motif cell wall-anchored protein